MRPRRPHQRRRRSFLPTRPRYRQNRRIPWSQSIRRPRRRLPLRRRRRRLFPLSPSTRPHHRRPCRRHSPQLLHPPSYRRRTQRSTPAPAPANTAWIRTENAITHECPHRPGASVFLWSLDANVVDQHPCAQGPARETEDGGGRDDEQNVVSRIRRQRHLYLGGDAREHRLAADRQLLGPVRHVADPVHRVAGRRPFRPHPDQRRNEVRRPWRDDAVRESQLRVAGLTRQPHRQRPTVRRIEARRSAGADVEARVSRDRRQGPPRS